jgi:hypothetical protein
MDRSNAMILDCAESEYVFTVLLRTPSTYTLAAPRVGPVGITRPMWLTEPAGTVMRIVADAPAAVVLRVVPSE